jgi:hypothetical protein
MKYRINRVARRLLLEIIAAGCDVMRPSFMRRMITCPPGSLSPEMATLVTAVQLMYILIILIPYVTLRTHAVSLKHSAPCMMDKFSCW